MFSKDGVSQTVAVQKCNEIANRVRDIDSLLARFSPVEVNYHYPKGIVASIK
jgi:hypothetical protein